MSPLRFCFVLHIHQPVGNFHHVFDDHARDVYRPFFDFLEVHELWPIGLHVSGPLLEWLAEHDAALHDRIGRLAADGRVEMLSSGWYEPVLAALSREDRAAQLDWTRDELRTRFGVTPVGVWLTERVWEPDLPVDLVGAGIEYALIDDHLARRAAVPEEHLQRPLRTEAGGRRIDLLPIDERLRYLIPFRPTREIEAELRRRHEAEQDLALIGDDGEKFGGWPGTREWLYEKGWLEDFGATMTRLREEGVVRLVAPREAHAEVMPYGPVYLPSGSYPEMESWAPGGHWKGFLGRYDEANRMQQRMGMLSELCRKRGDPPDVRRAIGRAQCNDPYWHGVFGGLYMKHLREGVRGQMLAAECVLRSGEPLDVTACDPAATGREGWWVHGASVSAWIDPLHGGTVTDLLWLERGVDVLDVLTRRIEPYHEVAVTRGTPGRPEEGPTGGSEQPDATPSIHEIEEGAILDRFPPADLDVRTLVRDRVLGPSVDLEAYREAAFAPRWAPGRAQATAPEPGHSEGGRTLMWTFRPADVGAPGFEKRLTVREDGSVFISWTWEPGDFEPHDRFAPELSFGAPVDLKIQPDTEVWRYPIVTLSKCPEGFEEIEQGESVTALWPIATGAARVVITPPRS